MATPAPGGGPLAQRYGSARHPGRPVARQRSPGTSDATVAALGKLSEALEVAEHARGLAGNIEQTLVGRDIVSGCWSFQLVEDYDSGYWDVFLDVEEHALAELGVPARHVFGAEMKEREQGAPAGAGPGPR